MKIPPQRVEAFLKAPEGAVRAVLVYGPDDGLVAERVARLGRGVVDDLADPFRVAEIAAAALRDDPAQLADEAAAIAMTGGRRLVRVTSVGDSSTKVFESFLAEPVGDALIVADGGELGPRSSLRRLFEAAANAAAIACYVDDGAGLASVIRETLARYDLVADTDALHFLEQHLGADRRLTRSELEKLALYMGKPGRILIEDVAACIGDGSALSIDDLVLAAADGQQAVAQHVLDRLLGEGISPIAVCRALIRHFQRLHLVAGQVDRGAGLEKALGSLRPPLHFRVVGRVRAQATRWTLERLGQALQLIVTAEIACKTTGQPANEICGRLLIQIARAARTGRR